MKTAALQIFGLVVATLGSSSLIAQTPAGSTGKCTDGTYTTAATKVGACSGHKGVQTWYGSMKAGGGPGMVWVNTDSKIYFCPGSQFYGKTKAGKYVTESAAKSDGNKADHGRSCSAK